VGGNWTLDLWFIHEQSRQFDLYHLESLAPRLTEETRVAILGIKHAWHGHRTTAATRSTPPSSTTAFVRRPSSAPT
jgi:hypothetical protein